MNKYGGDVTFISNNIRSIERFIAFLDENNFDPTNDDNTIFIVKDRERAIGNEKYYDSNDSTDEKLAFIDVENTNASDNIDITNFLYGLTLIKKKGMMNFINLAKMPLMHMKIMTMIKHCNQMLYLILHHLVLVLIMKMEMKVMI